MGNRLSLKEKLIFSCGNLGIGIIMTIHMWYLVYFFFPPSDAGINYTVPQESIFLGLTLLGLIMAAGRIFDAITDPIIANRCDNLQHRLGKRIPYLRRYALLMAASYVAVFFVPVPQSINSLNTIWLAVFMISSALFFTLYTVPYYSLFIFMAKHPEDKIDLGTYNSGFWFFGLLISSFASSTWDVIQGVLGVSRHMSIQISFVIVGLLGFIFLMIPAYFIDEHKYDDSKGASHENIRLGDSLKRVFKNKNFKVFLVANTCYTLATYMFETGLLYFITVLALKDETLQGPLTTVIGICTLLAYPLVNILAKKYGKRITLSIGFVLFALAFLDITVFGVLGNVNILIIILAILTPIPQAIFGILPNVVVSDCAEYDKANTGKDSSGMYVAVNGFFVKIGYSLATIIFTSLLLFGKDPSNDLGIRLTTVLGCVLALLSTGLMLRYDEGEIMTYVEKSKTP